MIFARFNIYHASGGPAPRVSPQERNCTLLGPETSYKTGTPLANLAPVKAEVRNKTDPVYILLAEASKTINRWNENMVNFVTTLTLHIKNKDIRIFHGCEVRTEKKKRPRVTVWHHEALPSDPEGQIFLYAPNNLDRFFFLQTFGSPEFDFNVAVAINVNNKSPSCALTSAILKVDVILDVAMTSTYTTKLHDLLYNQCIDSSVDMSVFRFLSTPRVG